MLLFLETKPLQTSPLCQLPKQGNVIYPADLLYLDSVDKVRQQIINGNLTKIPQYLQMHQQMQKVILATGSYHPNFQYTPMVSKCVISTSALSLNEAYEADYLMNVYAYACNQLHVSLPLIGQYRNKLIEGKKHNLVELQQILDNLKVGYQYLQYVQYNAQTLLPHLGKQTLFHFYELSPLFFNAFKAWYQVTANFIYLELEQDFTKKHQICLGINNLLNQIALPEQNRLTIYAQISKQYLQPFGYYIVIGKYIQLCQKEDFKQKNFTTMTTEIIQLSNDILRMDKQFQTIIADEDYLDFAKTMLTQHYVVCAKTQINVYSNIHHTKAQVESNEQIYYKAQPLNYFDIK